MYFSFRVFVSNQQPKESLSGRHKASLKHSDAQMVLGTMGLPLIDLQSNILGHGDGSSGAITIVDDDDNDVGHFAIVPFQADHQDAVMEPASSCNPGAQNSLIVIDDDGPRSHFQRSQESQAIVEINNNQQIVQPSASMYARNPGPFQLAKLRATDFGNIPTGRGAIVAEKVAKALEKQLEKNKDLRNQLRCLKRKHGRSVTTSQKRAKTNALKQYKGALVIETKGKTGKRLTEMSSFSVALRRNFSQIACQSLGSTLLLDISGQKVARSEIKTGASIVASMRSALANMVQSSSFIGMDRMMMPSMGHIHNDDAGSLAFQPGPWSLCVISFRSDATNSSVWKRESLHVCDVDVGWVCCSDAVRQFDADHAFRIKRCLCRA